MERDEGYYVRHLIRRDPDDFKGPQFFKNLRSRLSEEDYTTIGDPVNGSFSQEDAKAKVEELSGAPITSESGDIFISRGKVVEAITPPTPVN